MDYKNIVGNLQLAFQTNESFTKDQVHTTGVPYNLIFNINVRKNYVSYNITWEGRYTIVLCEYRYVCIRFLIY